MSVTTFSNAIVTWLAAVTGLTVIWANQSAHRPSYPYIVVDELTDRAGSKEKKWTEDEEAEAGEEMIEIAITHKQIVLNIQALNASEDAAIPHENTGKAYLKKVVDSLTLSTIRAPLRAANIAEQGIGTIQDLSKAENGMQISRASVDITFGTVSSYESPIPAPYIEKVVISSEIEGAKENNDNINFTDKEFGDI